MTRYYIFVDGKPYVNVYTSKSFTNFYEGYATSELAEQAEDRQVQQGMSFAFPKERTKIVPISYHKSIYNQLCAKRITFEEHYLANKSHYDKLINYKNEGNIS